MTTSISGSKDRSSLSLEFGEQRVGDALKSPMFIIIVIVIGEFQWLSSACQVHLYVVWPFVGRYTLNRHTGFPPALMRIVTELSDPVNLFRSIVQWVHAGVVLLSRPAITTTVTLTQQADLIITMKLTNWRKHIVVICTQLGQRWTVNWQGHVTRQEVTTCHRVGL